MKKIHIIISFFILSVCLIGCDTNDNTFYNDVFVNVPDLVTIEAPLTGYHAGDKIYVSSTINGLLAVPGQANLLDLRASTGNADKFYFSYVLEKQISGNDWEVINVDPSAIDLTAGSIEGGSFYYAGATYSAITGNYSFRAGIPLVAAGNYRLSFGYNSTSAQVIELRSGSINNNLFVNIVSNEANDLLNPAGYYTFTVL